MGVSTKGGEKKVLSERHYLKDELPKYKETIHQLKLGDTRFSALYNEYVDLDKAIYRIEAGIETTSEEYIETLKMQRVNLKVELQDMLERLERSRKVVDDMEKMNELLERRDELVARLESIEADYRSGLDANSSERALQLENAEVLDSIAKAAAEELENIEKKLARFA